MPPTIVNSSTATLRANIEKEGRIVLIDPLDLLGGTPGELYDMGLFPTDARIAPSIDVTRETIRAASREGGEDITVGEEVRDVTISYDIPVLSPDAYIRALHAGSAAVIAESGTLATVRAYGFNPSAGVLVRFINVRKRPSGVHRVIWHPRMQLSPQAPGDANGNDTLVFRGVVQAFTYTPGGALATFDAAITQYGAEFHVPDALLDELLEALQGEALPA